MKWNNIVGAALSHPYSNQSGSASNQGEAKVDLFSRSLGIFLVCVGIVVSVYFQLHDMACPTNTSCPSFISLLELGLFLIGLGVFFVVTSYRK
jgi:hypothetical protein